ncbi:MAG TPA: ATP-dependent zinc metalloprotease FtsH [Candidatus Saccharimonadales bacterium]|nr:ATP-dependent zinc metalloprotease FtsH [Candidatus Saccharimonadales bacterium]
MAKEPTGRPPLKDMFRGGKGSWNFPIWYFLLVVVILYVWQNVLGQMTVREISYSEFKMHLQRGEVSDAVIKDETVEGRIILHTGQPGPVLMGSNNVAAATNAPAKNSKASPETFMFRSIRVEDPDLVKELEKAMVKYRGERPSILTQFLISWIIPIAFFAFIWSFFSRRMGKAGESILSFGKSKARLVPDKDTNVSFNDVAGCEEAKYELQEVVDFLKNPDRYKAIGAKIPKGVLLVGPPGTGKTLLARAVAGEAHVPFFSMSGSDFVEMFVGVGASRVRDLFMQAKGKAPCIIFIDELDAIGRQRGVHVGAVNDEREQTLNQLLVEMDGFEANAGVILLAATNRPDVLDRALLRPGRFDRQVVVDAPDLDGRTAILKVHTRAVPLETEVDLQKVARATPGFSGADLANAVNESALLAARRHAKRISQHDLEEAVEKVVAGPERKSRRLTEEIKRRVAVHEVGHAVVAVHSEHADPVHKISIIPRGRAALGYTMQLPTEDQFLMTRAELLDKIRGLLGGRAAEEEIFGNVTTGAENDLERATALARQMVCLFGMSESVGLARVVQRQGPMFLAGGDGQFQRDCSEKTAQQIDEEVKKILDQSYAEAKEILSLHRDQLDLVTNELLKAETLDGDAFLRLVGKEPPNSETLPVDIAPQRVGPGPQAI